MRNYCLDCGKFTRNKVYNGEYYCNQHIKNGVEQRNNIKKSKRVYIDDEAYFELMRKAANLRMDIRSYISYLALNATA